MSNFNLFILLIVFGVIVLAGIGAGTFLVWQHLRTRGLRQQFGPEYDRAMEQTGSRKTAEAELLERRRRHQTLELRTLKTSEQTDFQQRWTDMQREFVDDPADAVRNADRLVVDVMSARGYPTGDLDQRAADLSVDHPKIAQHYRDARRIAGADEKGNASTEDLRQAVTSYRALLEELLSDSAGHDVELGGSRRRNGSRAGGRRRESGRSDDRATDVVEDRRDGRLNDRVDDRRDGRLNDRVDDRRDGRLNDRADDRRDGRLNDRADDRGDVRSDDRRDGRLNDRVDDDRRSDHVDDSVRRNQPGSERETRA